MKVKKIEKVNLQGSEQCKLVPQNRQDVLRQTQRFPDKISQEKFQLALELCWGNDIWNQNT